MKPIAVQDNIVHLSIVRTMFFVIFCGKRKLGELQRMKKSGKKTYTLGQLVPEKYESTVKFLY